MILLVISFIAGLLTVLAPCILPLLPVIVGGSLNVSDKGVNLRRALTVTLSLGASVIVFTLLLKASTLLIDIPEAFWKWLSGGIIVMFGIITLFPQVWERIRIAGVLNRHSNAVLGKHVLKKSFWGDVVVGAALGPVFSTCSPTYFIVLASVLPVNPLLGLTYLLAYVAGLCLALLLIAYVGQRIMTSLGIVANPTGYFKRSLGVVFLIVGIAVLTGYDKKVEAYLVSEVVYDITRIEQYLLQKTIDMDSSSQTPENEQVVSVSASTVESEMPKLTQQMVDEGVFMAELAKKSNFPFAEEISTPDGYINTEGKPITLKSLRGDKVVLLDIWTYSCINCQRTLPYLNAWHEKYAEDGLVIIGLHTPEFAFEQKLGNVEEAVKKFGIQYPVVLDNDYSTWRAYGNNFWPRKYLIDVDGRIVYDHIGEGAYDETEREIQRALKERAMRLKSVAHIEQEVVTPDGVVTVDTSQPRTPELYFGALRNTALLNGVVHVRGVQSLTVPTILEPHGLYLGGTWNFDHEYAESADAATITIRYAAKNVYMVLSADEAQQLLIKRDGVLLETERGSDVASDGTMNVFGEQLYHVVADDEYGEHVLEISVPKAGVRAFTFTFG
jgi:cytochrome c biogenesis protein CcdA/thiol-disulfide isomerase/thioredoxin